MDDLKVKGKVQGVANSGELSGVWENSWRMFQKKRREKRGEWDVRERERDLGEKGRRSWLTGHLKCHGAGAEGELA